MVYESNATKGKKRIRLFPVGRLDKNSHGLLLLTNDGQMCNQLLHPDYYHEKEYIVTVNKALDDTFKTKMENGIQFENRKVKTKPCCVTLSKNDPCKFEIILTQGLNRQ